MDVQQLAWFRDAAAQLGSLGTGANGSAIVELTIDPSGLVTGTTVTEQSGDPRFATATLALLRQAGPLPPPPSSSLRADGRMRVSLCLRETPPPGVAGYGCARGLIRSATAGGPPPGPILVQSMTYVRDGSAAPGMTAQEARAYFSDRTNVSFSPGHGTQVEYTNASGRAFLWYPGNAVILPGRWSTAESTTVAPLGRTPPGRQAACFQYGANTFNPVTGVSGGGPECTPADPMRARAVDGAAGDIFGLSTRGTPPFVLPRDRMTIADLQARLSGAPARVVGGAAVAAPAGASYLGANPFR